MLEHLDEIDWNSLEHSYGPASDVPAAIRSLLSENEDEWREALDFFWGKVIHQGTVSSATPRTIPFLLEVIEICPESRKPELLELISAFAGASTCPEYSETGPDVIEDCRLGVSRGWQIYLQIYLNSSERGSCAAALALSYCCESALEVAGVLAKHLEHEPNPWKASSGIIAVGKLAGQSKLEWLLHLARSVEHSLVRFCASRAVLESAKDDSPEDIKTEILSYLQNSTQVDDFYERLSFGNGESPLGETVQLICRLESFAEFVPGIRAAMQRLRKNDTASILVASAILERAFPRESFYYESLTPLQCLVIETFVNSDRMWDWGNVLNLLREYGLPQDREELKGTLRAKA